MDTNSPTPDLPPPDYDTTYHHHPPPSCVVDASSSSSHHRSARSRNPRKKRTITISDKNNNNNNNNNVVVLKANNNKIVKKPDPRAPKITRPCTECGKKFWSWKALFGHMRCHPERQWRGINPPPNLARQQHHQHQHQHQYHDNDHHQLVGEEMTSNEDREAAACLLLLANRTGIGFGNGKGKGKGKVAVKEDEDINMNMRVNDGLSLTTAECLSLSVCGQQQERFECSSCKKVFGSHQALGGHRASHKNVKGCFAINVDDHNLVSMNHMIHSHSGGVGDAGGATCSSGLVGDYHYQHGDDTNGGDQNQQQQGQQDEGHKCSICHRVFSTGQALGGHKRCHWDKGGDVILSNIAPPTPPPNALPLDLNFPPLPPQQEPPPLSLDLRLAL